jgi:hypothetical protein
VIKTVVLIVYIVLGFFVANDHNYLNDLDSIGRVLSAILAVILWPLIVLGVDLQFGDDIPDIRIRD